jgi:aspartate aminotransferase-like enzyme
MGYVNDFDVIIAVAALEKGLYDAGYAVELGKGLSTVQSILVGKK